MNILKSVLVSLSAMQSETGTTSIRGSKVGLERRQLQNVYFSTTDLGGANPDAAIGNPLKGFLTSPRWTGGNTPDTIPSSLEFYYIGWDEVMRGLNDFTWDVLDQTIQDAERHNNHVMWRIYAHYPGKPLRVPQFLLNAGIELVDIGGEDSPQYDDPLLLNAMENFITAFGARYDGHKTVANVQAGLLGKWGEWHTYPQNNLLSDSTKDKVVDWYSRAFPTTQLQIRNPHQSAYNAGIGLHDDSFAFSTLDGAPNGGQEVGWFFWPTVKSAQQTDFWKKSVMGGETRPELQDSIFKDDYPAGTEYHQNFMECVETTHVTYLFHHYLFQGNSYGSSELANARHAHARMGYNFEVTEIAAASSTGGVTIDATVEQTGVAPFYYPLNLQLECSGKSQSLSGVETLVEKGDSKVFRFTGVPATASCLNSVKITLESEFAYEGKPVRFAQGNDGTVSLNIPVPSQPGTSNGSDSGEETVTETNIDGIDDGEETFTGTSIGGEDPTCFSGSNTVDVRGKGVVAMDELRIGDYVRTADDEFSQVFSFSHIERDEKADYLQIRAQGVTAPLEISSNHMLYVDGSAIRAKDVKVGDMMGSNKVLSIETVQRVGIYAPVTTSGNIIVSGILASCFVALMDVPAQIQHSSAHALHAPLRLACAADFGICENETYTAGRSNFVWAVIQLARSLSQLPLLVQLAAALVAAPCLIAAYAIEQLASAPVLFLSIALALSFWRRRGTGKSHCKTL